MRHGLADADGLLRISPRPSPHEPWLSPIASGRDVSYAQLDDQQDHLQGHEALSVARNVRATRTAIEQLSGSDEWSVDDIEQVHQALGVIGAAKGLRSVDVCAEDSCDRVRRIQDEVEALDAELAEKAAGLRADSSARRMLPVLREQPVVTAKFIAHRLGVSAVAAHRAVDTLVTRGILTPGTGKYRRSETFQAEDVLRLIDDAS